MNMFVFLLSGIVIPGVWAQPGQGEDNSDRELIDHGIPVPADQPRGGFRCVQDIDKK